MQPAHIHWHVFHRTVQLGQTLQALAKPDDHLDLFGAALARFDQTKLRETLKRTSDHIEAMTDQQLKDLLLDRNNPANPPASALKTMLLDMQKVVPDHADPKDFLSFIKLAKTVFSGSDLKNVSEILGEMTLRAAIADTPWSGAFISYVVKSAYGKKTGFKYSSAHREYIAEAIETSKKEGGAQIDKLYRACDPAHAKLAPGDLVCYKRPKGRDGPDKIRQEALGRAGAAAYSSAHCDVVARVGNEGRSAYVIGGNVAQSVTVKQLQLAKESGTLIEDQSAFCLNNAGLDKEGRALARHPEQKTGTSCSLNDQRWFAVLQIR